jgi:hypothetical protein
MSFSRGELLPKLLCEWFTEVPELFNRWQSCPEGVLPPPARLFQLRVHIIARAAGDSAIRIIYFFLDLKEEDPGLVRGMTTRGRGVETEAGPE